jgi:DNA modification methylase
MLAFALRADGWWLRQEIIWHKPNPMPESVRDRCTKAHEQIFLLAKSKTYYCDMEAIKEPVTGGSNPRGSGVNPKSYKTPDGWDTSKGRGGHGAFHREGREDGQTGYQHKTRPKQNDSFSAAVTELVDNRNKRSVWTIATEPFPEAHFATFPRDLVRPCILAGCPQGGRVLDPFCGSGTTLQVARELNCLGDGIEMNLDYIRIAERRLSQSVMDFSEIVE